MKLKVIEQTQVVYYVDLPLDAETIFKGDYYVIQDEILALQPPREEWEESVFERDWEEAK